MVPRFNCRHDDGMYEEEGGQYVDAYDYDKLLDRVKRTIDRLVTGRDEPYMCAEDEQCGMACAVDDSLGILTECAEEDNGS